MSDSVDYYDVQAMIRDARHEITAEIQRAINTLRDELRSEINALTVDTDELRYRVEELQRAHHEEAA